MIARRFCHRPLFAFLMSSAFLLLLTGLAKIFSLVHGSGGPILDKPDSVIWFVSNRAVLSLAATLEILLAGFLIVHRNRQPHHQLLMLAWFSTLIWLYRFARFLSGDPAPCKCLGDLLAWTGLSDDATRNIILGVLIYVSLPPFTLLSVEALQSWLRGVDTPET